MNSPDKLWMKVLYDTISSVGAAKSKLKIFSQFKSLADEWRCLAAYIFLIIVVVSLNLHYWLKKESFHPSYQSIVCFARLLFRSIYIDKTKVDRVGLTFTTTKTLYADFVSHFIYLDILRHKREIPFSPCIVLILMYRYCVHVHQFILFVWGTTLYIFMSALPFGYVFLQYIL